MAEANRKLAAILSADMAGYSRLMGADEEATVAALNACRNIFKDEIESRQGRVVDTAGDSVLAEFPSVVEAVRAAAALSVLPRPPLTADMVTLMKRDNVVGAGALGLEDLGISPIAVEEVLPTCVGG